ncbi:5'-methylthioadenosine/S-adenosylhomocysteine nucleosidase [Brachybacterium sp. MASK1Z-5]|uniref:adenosylhomocysteine nucleosidase n=1 Tax=Brachybacterium halotolerans TaxID=2795215 RepID=A0ABS1BBD6_9MICO|nr:5'-methylthioadenosine/S-adenosylhomocysteine nucleosidase [Brachybacterium halotolerans]MBK0331807.1 5'-methylthioadenosine/S-adenosylhomocysteine nucleosidase [Brachybacterium halotolerans]
MTSSTTPSGAHSPAADPDADPAVGPAVGPGAERPVLPGNGPVLILAAMDEEASPLVERMLSPRRVDLPLSAPAHAWAGTLGGLHAVVATSGIGISAATAAATWGILTQRPRLVISAGSAGGLASGIGVGTLVIGESFTYSIADATAFGYAPGQVPGGPERFRTDPRLVDLAARAAEEAASAHGVRRGLMLSGDAFVTAEIAAPMRERFPGALSADMESTAIAQTCSSLGVPFLAMRAISDLCGPEADEQFHLELDVVAETSARAVCRLLEDVAAG